MPLIPFWTKFLRDDDACIGLFNIQIGGGSLFFPVVLFGSDPSHAHFPSMDEHPPDTQGRRKIKRE
jgi:hypothetical protein